jgi:hypothetical protein
VKTHLMRSALALLLIASVGPLAHAAPPQDPDPTPDATGGEDPELLKLREAADEELTGPDAASGSEEDRLRAQADLIAEEDEDPEKAQLLAAFSSIANRLNAFNPRITIFGDALGRVAGSSAELVEEGRNRDDRLGIREIELDFRADIDPFAKGVLILAAEEEEPGEYALGVEEAYLTFETLPFGFRGKLGRFRIPFGRINQLHTHDLPQATRPYPSVDVFGEEGFVENAAQLSWLTPWIPLEFHGLVLNGENEAFLAGGDSDDPAFLGRAEYFIQLHDTAFLSLGASYLFGYNDAPDPATDRPSRARQESHLWGADLLFKWQPSQFRSVVVQGEVHGLKKERPGRVTEHGFGAYGFVQVQPFQRWFVGARYDFSNYMEGQEDRKQHAVGGWVSFYTTEFLRLRVGYEHRERSTTRGGEPDLDTFYFQVTFVFGSHPVEPFWFNR